MNENEPESHASSPGVHRNPSFYEILDIPTDAGEMEVDHAFARFLQEPGSDARLTSQRKHAWEVLRDPLNRSFYDEYLAKQRADDVRSVETSFRRSVGSMSTFTLGSRVDLTAAAPSKGRRG